MELIRLHDVKKTYFLGEVDVPVLKGVSLEIGRMAKWSRLDGRVRLRQVDADEHPSAAFDRPTSGPVPGSTARRFRGLSGDERAASIRNHKIGFCLSKL